MTFLQSSPLCSSVWLTLVRSLLSNSLLPKSFTSLISPTTSHVFDPLADLLSAPASSTSSLSSECSLFYPVMRPFSPMSLPSLFLAVPQGLGQVALGLEHRPLQYAWTSALFLPPPPCANFLGGLRIAPSGWAGENIPIGQWAAGNGRSASINFMCFLLCCPTE